MPDRTHPRIPPEAEHWPAPPAPGWGMRPIHTFTHLSYPQISLLAEGLEWVGPSGEVRVPAESTRTFAAELPFAAAVPLDQAAHRTSQARPALRLVSGSLRTAGLPIHPAVPLLRRLRRTHRDPLLPVVLPVRGRAAHPHPAHRRPAHPARHRGRGLSGGRVPPRHGRGRLPPLPVRVLGLSRCTKHGIMQQTMRAAAERAEPNRPAASAHGAARRSSQPDWARSRKTAKKNDDVSSYIAQGFRTNYAI